MDRTTTDARHGARPHRPRAASRTAAALIAAALAVAAAPLRPAEAIAVNTLVTTTTPATWVDDQGRQYEIVSTTGGTLNIARDTVTGLPDTTWGTAGVRGLALAPPATGATLSSRVAVTDAGVLTVVFSEPGCAESGICDRLFARYDGSTGEAVGDATTVPDERAVFRALDDGSVLLGTTETALRWFGPDGVLRAAPGLTGAQLDGADVDTSGRLLVLATDGTLTRWAATNPAEPGLTIDTVCGADMPGGAVGAGPGGSFAVVCAESGAGAPTTTRYDGAGTATWTVPGTAPNVVSVPVQRVTIDASGRVWYGGYAPGTVWLFLVPGRLAVASVTSAGAGPTAYTRAVQRFTETPSVDTPFGGITDLRTTADGAHVAMADLKLCCQYPNNFSPATAAYGEVLPIRPGPPRCAPAPTVEEAWVDAVQVRFSTCSDSRPNSRPTGYRLEASGPAGTASTTVADTGAGNELAATLTGLTAGRRAAITVTPFNDLGDTAATVGPRTTVLPFRTVAAFVDVQARTLGGAPLSSADQASYTASVTDGSLSPDAFMEQIITSGGAPLESVEPTARIYRAAFLRDADIGGLRFWYAKHRSGTRIAAIAEQFARSSEFQRRYGSLGNRAFVQRIYQNVLGRPGDAAGIDFWTRRLDTRRATRGAVLASFSESGEFVRKTNGIVQPLTVTFLMLDRRPTAAEKTTWSAAEAVYADMPEAILATQEYLDRLYAD